MSSALVKLENLSKSFPGVLALDGVSMRLEPGRIHALVGENGAGKSTLINILSGVLQPDDGEIRIGGEIQRFRDARAARGAGVVVVHQEVDLFPDLNVAENLGLEQGLPRLGGFGVDWRTVYQHARRALASVGEHIGVRTQAGNLSPAQRQMLLIAGAVAESARVLILDEPTSSLSEAESRVLFHHLRRIRDTGAAILYVSHRLEEIFALADTITVLRDGQHVWTGSTGETNPSILIEQMVGRQVKQAVADRPPVAEDAPVVFSCEKLTAADGTFRDITLQVRAGEVLGLYGLIGAGRTEFAQAVFGLRRLHSGEVFIDGKRAKLSSPGGMMRQGVAYVPEDRLRFGLCRGLSVLANAVLASLRSYCAGPFVRAAVERSRAKRIIEQMHVRTSSPLQRIGTLSGGNQQKVVVGRWLETDPKVLLLDEPTRGVDVGAKAEIHGIIHELARRRRAIILISSELSEVMEQSHRIGVLRDGKLIGIFDPRKATAAEIASAAVPVTASDVEHARSDGGRFSLVGTLLPGLRELALLLVIAVLWMVVQAVTGKFLTMLNLTTIIHSTALLSFPALGAAVVIMAGGIDISIGRLQALSAALAGYLWLEGWPLPVVIMVAVATGTLGGLANAAISLYGRVHPIVVTLGMMSIYFGLMQWCLSWMGGTLDLPDNEMRAWIQETPFGIPVPGFLGLIAVAAIWAFLTMTVPGREIYAFGDNSQAAERLGIGARRVWLRAFALQGALIGTAGFLGLNYIGTVETVSFEDVTLQAIAAAVIGGVAITGGRGSAWGVLFGCLFLASLEPACIVLDISIFWQKTVVGAVMAAAITIDALMRKGTA